MHVAISGLSVLIKMRGWPSGPPPPSHDTTLCFVQRTGCLWINSMAAYGRGYKKPINTQLSILFQAENCHTCASIIVCSNLGPDIPSSRGCWLGAQVVARFGACSCRACSPASGASAMATPSKEVCTALVSETLGVGLRGVGSLVGTESCVSRGAVIEYAARGDCTARRAPCDRKAAVDAVSRENIVGVVLLVSRGINSAREE